MVWNVRTPRGTKWGLLRLVYKKGLGRAKEAPLLIRRSLSVEASWVRVELPPSVTEWSLVDSHKHISRSRRRGFFLSWSHGFLSHGDEASVGVDFRWTLFSCSFTCHSASLNAFVCILIAGQKQIVLRVP